ncbi:hypothetical protein M422DRAFT_238481 [Sphaerobolus stellatus SS14]|nr:hypothetical protein M422DRAFT_238481 [Sphaerobolus stellatus SS14]
MDCLELNLQQLILSDLARNVGQSKDTTTGNITAEDAVGLISSNVETRDISEEDGEDSTEQPRMFMSTSRIFCNIGFAELAPNIPETHVTSAVSGLIEILHDVPYIDFDRTLSWTDWAWSDQLTFATVSSLLRLAVAHPGERPNIMKSIFNFASITVSQLKDGDPTLVISQFAPAFHGFYRAVIDTPFPWTLLDWHLLSADMGTLFEPEVVERLNNLLVESSGLTVEDQELQLFVQTLLSRYVSSGRPLTGYFAVCCVIEIQGTVLAQTLCTPESCDPSSPPDEAAAANSVWASLIEAPVQTYDIEDEVIRNDLALSASSALRCYTDLLLQIEELEGEPSVDTYAWETMAESLKLASVCSVALQDLDVNLFPRLKTLLSDASPISDALVQEAALEAMTVLVHNFPSIASDMAYHLRRFITAPLPIFEAEYIAAAQGPPPLVAAAKCLSFCIKYAPGDDIVLSNMYSLLNYIAATSQDMGDSALAKSIGASPYIHAPDHINYHSVETGLRGYSDDEKQLIGISTISVVTRLALEFKLEEVIRLTISMLLQRLRLAEPAVEAAISYNLVELALEAPPNAFLDIVRTFSSMSRTTDPDDPRFPNNVVLTALTRLARELRKRPEFRDIYLQELLLLFSDKGVSIQTVATSDHPRDTHAFIEQLSTLLLPLAALLGHEDFTPDIQSTPELVNLFRNMWFLCALFGFTHASSSVASRPTLKDALTQIAINTPPLVREEENEYLTSALEYNSVIRHDYAHNVSSLHREILSKHIPLRAGEIRHLHHAHLIFLLTMHDLEMLRATAGLSSSLVTYFVNASLNKHPAVSACMDSVAEKVMRDCQADISKKMVDHNVPLALTKELRTLLIYSCHRISKTREIASRYLNRLIATFPSLLCNSALVYAILEVLTLLRRACEGEYTDEFNPVFVFTSERAGINLELTDSYSIRNEILNQLYRNANNWFQLALGKAPVEIQGILQKYLTYYETGTPRDSVELGASVALHFASSLTSAQRAQAPLPSALSWRPDRSKALTGQIACKEHFAGESEGFRLQLSASMKIEKTPPAETPEPLISALKTAMKEALECIRNKTSHLTIPELKRLLFRCSAVLATSPQRHDDLIHYLVALPYEIFTPATISVGIEAWTWLIGERSDLEMCIMLEFHKAWAEAIRARRGMFSDSLNCENPFYNPVKYSPTDKAEIDLAATAARRLLTPHTLLLHMLMSRFQAIRYYKPNLSLWTLRLVLRSAQAHRFMSTHPLAREDRFTFLIFGFEILRASRMDAKCEARLRRALYMVAFSWFAVPPKWSYGTDRIQLDTEIRLLNEFFHLVQSDSVRSSLYLSALDEKSASDFMPDFKNTNLLLRLLVENEIYRLCVWKNPTNDSQRGTDHLNFTEKGLLEPSWRQLIRTAWKVDPAVAIHLTDRFKNPIIADEVGKWVRSNTRSVTGNPAALKFLLDQNDSSIRRDHKHLVVWAPVTPIVAVSYFEPKYHNDPVVLQYAHRVLEQHPVDLTFFFVPQVVQALRNDALGYVERFIFETARISQLFCHQIIWNMKANCYKDDLAEVEDPLKPTLDQVMALVVNSLSGEAKDFYTREFHFFNEVTAISGKLKPYIRKSKPEKKAKIDEEMAKIVVDVGVYLPSNPDGIVVDIDKKSGRPLQSHAKAPFMATFKVRKKRLIVDIDPDSVLEGEVYGHETEVDIWQQAIFKVGDDCRQDVLALQIIAMFKNIFTTIGLNLYLYPYRVTATAPGCGIIDVVPNATSRDEMGRAKINDLLAFFTTKYGSPDTIQFQRARLNFIQSMAAYSVACYILQIKDRHNGNIMIDGEGHIVHIGKLNDETHVIKGIKFEPNSFKLSHEMVMLMGGRYSQGYTLFTNLTVKAFLAIRPYADHLINTVHFMLGTGLPSFKGEPTIQRLRDRFVLHMNEREAAEHMMKVIKNAHENVRSVAYDEFQRLQNGIPHA